VKISGNILEF